MRRTVLLAACCFLCAACTFEVGEKSFSSSLNEIDVDITNKEYSEAKKKLEALQKTVRKGEDSLSVYKRYKALADGKSALKMLERALGMDRKDDKLRAAYVDLLLRSGDKKKALKAALPLKGGEYGSLYSECFLAFKDEKSNFYDPAYYSVYYDAWKGTEDEAWLVNCAVLKALEGRYTEGAALGSEARDEKNAEFWAKLSFDAALYDESISHSKRALRFYERDSELLGRSEKVKDILSMKVLTADAYTKLEDYEAAESIRRPLLNAALMNQDEEAVKDEELYRSIFTNSAFYNLNEGRMKRAAKLLIYTLNAWEDYVPALTLYSYMARETDREFREDEMERRLRASGIKTLKMAKRDARTVIPVKDALYRLDKAIEKSEDPLLSILKLNLIFAVDKKMSYKEKRASLYLLLEKAATSAFVYPQVVLDFALSFLVRHEYTDEAFSLFMKHLSSKYELSFKDEEEFWKNAEKRVNDFDVKETEYAAFFAAVKKKAHQALFLHEAALAKGDVSVSTSLNLADIYFSRGNNKDALKLYTGCVGRVLDLRKKSYVVYLVACVYKKMGDEASARRFAEYALTLNRANADAGLLLYSMK